MERRLVAILFTDVVGYTALMGRDEAAGRRVRGRHESLVRALVSRYGGRWVEEKGDESLSIFPSALDAVSCALAIQTELADDSELSLRVGIHLGDVTVEGDRVFGDGVNVAARIRPLAEPGSVCVSGPVYDSIKNQPQLAGTSLGERELKGVAVPVAVYAVSGTAGEPAPRAGPEWETPARRAAPLAAVGMGVLVLLAAALWWAARTPTGAEPIRSLAVLPLKDPSNDPEQAYFAFGLTEALIAELAKLEDLSVISRTSITPYEDTTKSVPTIAGELGVQAVIEGSVMRFGDRVRITAQLIDARTDTHLWSESYERDLADVLALQAEVAAEIARQIHLEVSPAAVGAAPPRPVRPEAQEAYLKGYFFQNKRTRASTLKAVSYFQQAITLDPTSPLGYAALADEYSCAPTHAWGIPDSELWPSVPREMMGRAREHATNALALDPGSPAGHNSIALVRTYGDWDWPGAEAAYKRTLEISPSRSWAHQTYGLFLSHMRRFDEALHHLETARALDPLRVDTLMWLASLHLWRSEPDKAMARWREATEIDPGYPGLLQSILTSLCGTEQHDQAIAALETGARKFPNDPIVMGNLAHCLALAGDEAGARGLLREMQAQAGVMYVSPVSRALVHVGLGEADAAFEALEQGFRDRDSQLLTLGLDPIWEPLRGDPRYAELMDRIGLPRGSPRLSLSTGPVE